MANELIFSGDPASDSGLTVTAKVYGLDGVQVGTDVSLTEVGTIAFYRGDMPSASAAKYVVRYFSGSTLLGQEVFLWDGTAEVFLSPQAVRDAVDLPHTDTRPGLTVSINNAPLMVRI